MIFPKLRAAVIGLATSVTIGATSVSAAAQVNPAGKFYVGAAVEGSSQEGGPRSVQAPDQPNARVGGSAWSFAGTVGYRFTSLLSISAEASVPSRFTSLQQVHYFQDSQSEIHYRDNIVSALAHLHLYDGTIRPALVVGFSFVYEDALIRTAMAPSFGPGAGVFGPYSWQNSTTRLFRLHAISRTDFGEPNGFLYLSPVVIRTGIGLRVGF